MALIVDAGALCAQADAREPYRATVTAVPRQEMGALVTSQFVAAEADYLILDRLGVGPDVAFLDDLNTATFVAEGATAAEIGTAKQVAAKYRDLKLGIADASLVVLARRHNTRRILTLDERAFRAISPLQRGAFGLLPSDA